MAAVRLSGRGLAQLRQLEGCRLDAYQDEAGVWTIGYGHTRRVKPGDRITAEQAELLLRSDVADFEAAVSDLVNRQLTEGESDALVLFAFNIGTGALGGSTLLRKVNEGDRVGAALEFVRWIHVTVETQVRRGDSGPAVRSLQKELVGAGFNVAIDGNFGPGTETALRAWQQAKGRTVDGIGRVREKRASANLVSRRFWEVVRFLT